MNFRHSLSFSILLTLFCIGFSHMTVPGAQPPGLPSAGDPGDSFDFMQQMSEDDFIEWQQQMDAEINQYVSSLPPEQQEQFHKDVEELEGVMRDMSDEEFTDFFQSLLPPDMQDELEKQMQAEKEKETTDETTDTTVKTVESPKRLHSDEKINSALQLINSVLEHSERFLRTAQRIPELSGKIEKWVEKKKLTAWSTDITWDTLKGNIELFNQKLHQLIEKDPVKKKEYRYIDSFIKDTTTYNNLSKINDDLTKNEPKIEAPAFGLGSVSKDSKKAIRSVVTTLTEAIHHLKLNDALDKLLGTFEPRAKQLSEQEEALRKKAFEESKKTVKPSPKREASRRAASYNTGYDDYTGYDSGYYDDPYAYSPQYTAPSYTPSYREPARTTDRRSRDQKQTKGKDKQKQSDKKTNGKDTDKKKGSTDKKDEKLSRTVENALNQIENNVEGAADLLGDNNLLDNAKTYLMQEAKDVSKAQSAYKAVESANAQIRRARRRIDKLAGEKNKSKIASELKGVLKKHNALFNNLPNKMAEVTASKVPAGKRYLFFGGKKTSGVTKEIYDAVPEPSVTITELVEQIKKLKTDINSFK